MQYGLMANSESYFSDDAPPPLSSKTKKASADAQYRGRRVECADLKLNSGVPGVSGVKEREPYFRKPWGSVMPEGTGKRFGKRQVRYISTAASRNEPNPVKDFEKFVNGEAITKEFLIKNVMRFMDVRGVKALGYYCDNMYAQMDREHSVNNINEKNFCSLVRKNALALVEIILKDNQQSETVMFRKLYLLSHSGKFCELLVWAETMVKLLGGYPNKPKGKLLVIELKKIDAFIELARYEEALTLMKNINTDYVEGVFWKSMVKLHVRKKEFDQARIYLKSLRSKNIIKYPEYDRTLRWVDYCDKESAADAKSEVREPVFCDGEATGEMESQASVRVGFESSNRPPERMKVFRLSEEDSNNSKVSSEIECTVSDDLKTGTGDTGVAAYKNIRQIWPVYVNQNNVDMDNLSDKCVKQIWNIEYICTNSLV
ncbi:hypothetical protein [Endozoicomonas sp.]|uniref:hypothetical protein n=1 Tax=Endozoicomonas sp. TaxID=1892382 RepID=UPI002884B253|nr:hypothetical protein [Endozoicomonas sp.]